MHTLGVESRQTLRMLVGRRSGWAPLVLLSVGVGVAATAFSVGYALSRFGVRYPDAGQVVGITCVTAQGFSVRSSRVDLETWTKRTDVFDGVAGYSLAEPIRLRVTEAGVVVRTAAVTPNLFDVLKIAFPGLWEWKSSASQHDLLPLLVPSQTLREQIGVGVVGHVVDRQDGGHVRIVAAIPEDFVFPRPDTPVVTLLPMDLTGSDVGDLNLIGRLRQGMSAEAAEARLSCATRPNGQPLRAKLTSVQRSLAGKTEAFSVGIWLLSACVLLACAANIANVLLTQVATRTRDYDVRIALGATRLALFRLMFLEVIILVCAAVPVALLVAEWLVGVSRHAMPLISLGVGRPTVGAHGIVFTIASAVLTMLTAAVPALIQIGRHYEWRRTSGKWGGMRRPRTVRFVLAATQTMIAVLLVITADMAGRSYYRMVNQDVGFDRSVTVVSVSYPPWRRQSEDGGRIATTLDAVAAGRPGLSVAACTGSMLDGVVVGGLVRFPDVGWVSVRLKFVSPGFFGTLKTSLVSGRELDRSDRAEQTAVMSASLVRLVHWSPIGAVGQTLSGGDGVPIRVVGVVQDIFDQSFDVVPEPTLFVPLKSRPFPSSLIHYVVRVDKPRSVGDLAAIVAGNDRDAIIVEQSSLGERLGASVRGRTLAMRALILFASGSLGIVIVGLASSVAFIVGRRTREIAVRVAVGASRARVRWLVMGEMVWAGVAGLIVGIVIGWSEASTMSAFFYGAETGGWRSISSAAVVLLVTVILASWVPANRALRIQPSQALRTE